MSEQRDQIADRLQEAGLGTERFIDVEEKGKASLDHTTYKPEDVDGNYGIYATAEGRLVILDIDDYDDLDDRSGLTALSELPATLEQKSPHGGTHRLYAVEKTVDGRFIADVLKDEYETSKGNLNPSWGEVRVANQYVVGAGSELDHGACDDGKNGCPGEGIDEYELHTDREVATVSPADLLSVLDADPAYSDEETEDDAEENSEPTDDADAQDVLSYALNESNDDKLQRLWRGDYSDYGGDRSRAESAVAYKLAFWLQGDKTAVRRVMNGANLPSDVPAPNLQKWSEREDASYRDSVLQAVDEQTDHFDPGQQTDPDPSTVDYTEVERGEAILRAEAEPENPAGELDYQNGCYGYVWVNRDDDGNIVDSGFDAVTNFKLETLSKLDTYEGNILSLRVHPNHPMEAAYDIEVHPTVFNEAREFREEVVRGTTTWFQPSQANRTAQQVLSDLRQTVGSQMAPQHTGTEYIGMHGSDYAEWVTPAGTLTPDGWSDEAEFQFYEKGGSMDTSSSLAEKWTLDPEDGAEYDEDTVAAICEKLPWTRLPERGLPVLGWYYAAPLKPLIYDEFGANGERQFNLLQAVGGTGTGKTSTLEMYYELFGANPNPYGCGDKAFTIEKKLASSCGLPIWLDEYKPTDLAQGKMHWLHRRFREVFREQSLSKGLPSLGEVTFTLRAPVVFSGEQVVETPAVRRRTIVTQFSSDSTSGEYREAFKALQGAEYNFRDHALAYYQYVLDADTDDLAAMWDDAGETVARVLEDLGVDSLSEDSEVQGLKTIVFGYEVFKEFAGDMGADVSELPGESAVRDAIQHVAENIGPDGRRRQHIDDFTELVAQAALEDYIEEGVHYRIVDSQKYGDKVLAFHMPSTFTAVKQFLKQFNLENEYSLLGKTDFLDNYNDKAGDESAYPLATNQKVRGIENGSKAVYIDVEKASKTLGEEFELSAFTDVDDQEEADENGKETDDGTVLLAEVEDAYSGPGSVSVRVTVTDTVDPKPWLQAEGTVEDDSASLDFQARGDSSPLPANPEGTEYIVRNVRLTSGEYGEPILEFRPDTEFDAVAATPADQQSVTEPVADGGDSGDDVAAEAWEVPKDAEGNEANARRAVAALLAADSDALSREQLRKAMVSKYPGQGLQPTEMDHAIDAAVSEYGWFVQEDGVLRKG